jgi:hypothetical protein
VKGGFMTRRTSRSTISRRALLGLGLGAAAALPLLRWSGRARAASGPAPRRLVLFPSLNGAAPEHFWPNPGNLAAMSLITEPLAAWRDQITFVRGVDIDGSYNHFAVRSMFTGYPVNDYLSPDPTVKSLDQVVADHVASTAPTPLRSLHLGAIPADSIDFYQLYGRSTFFFNPTPVHYEANPVTAFDAVFGGLGRGEPDPDAPGADRRADALAITRAELADLERRVARSPREASKLAEHGRAVAELGGGGAPVPASCDATPIPSVEALRPRLAGNARAAYDHALFSGILDAQLDVAARALVCGLTRVATIQAGSADGNVIVPVDGGYPHHNTSHGDAATFGRVQRWYAGKLARLLAALDVPDPLDPGRTVLDNSCVVWLSECNPSHGSEDVPAFFVGGAGGALRTGTFVEAPGATNKTLLKAIGRALGVPDAATGHLGATALTEVLA